MNITACTDLNHTRYADDIGCLDCADAAHGVDAADNTWSYTFPADRVEDFNHIIDKANRRLERAGATARFTPVVTLKEISETAADGITRTVTMATATMESLRLSLGRYTFVARLVPEEAGMTVHTAPGESLEGWVRPAADDTHCDHCGVKRDRVNLFVVRDDETGQLIQLGQQCIALYTGMQPKGLWALDFDGEISAAVGGWSEGDSLTASFDIHQVLGLSMALTNGGKAYVSRTNAELWEKTSTVSEVTACLYRWLPTDAECRKSEHARKYRERLLQAIEDGLAMAKDEVLMAEIRSAATSLRAGTDYADNMAVILAAESGRVSRKNIGTLASLVAIYHRLTEERAAATKPAAAQGFIGSVGERLRDFTVTATSVREFDGDFGTTTLLVGVTDDGHVVKWFASGTRNWDAGDRIHFAAATVKGHENYKGTDQTTLTRGHKVEVVQAVNA